jgi:hypothetical protein
MPTCYLRMGNDYLEDATRFRSIGAAADHFHWHAQQLARYDQRIEASIHIADNMDEVVEYPDLVLKLGPRGGLRKERT